MGMDAPDPDEAEGPSEAPPLGALERLRGLQAPRAIDLLVKPEVGVVVLTGPNTGEGGGVKPEVGVVFLTGPNTGGGGRV